MCFIKAERLMNSNISSLVEFKRWWVLKSKNFDQELKKFLRGMPVHQKLYIILEIKVVQKLSLEKKCVHQKMVS